MIVFSVRSKRLFSIVKLFVYSMKIIGLAPFGVQIKSSAQIIPFNSRVEVFRYSKIGLAYNILLLIPVLFMAIVELCPHFHIDAVQSSVSYIVSHSIDRANVFLINLTACLVLIAWGIRHERAASVMNELLEVDLGLTSFEKPPFNKLALIFAIIHVLLNTSCWIFYLTWEIFHYVDVYCISSTVSFCLPRAIIFWFITEYYIVVGLVASGIETVNEYLLNFKETGTYLFPPSFRHGLQPTYYISSSQDLAYRKLLHYRAIRTRLYKLCGEIGDFFSMPILLCVACCFIALFHSLFKACWFYREDKMNSAAEMITWLAMDALLYAYPVVSLALNVTRIRREAQLTKQIVDKLSEVAIRGEIISELELFSRQLQHENVSFTAYGFFSLDSNLLLSMLGGTITYFVALMQFPDKNCSQVYQKNSTILHAAEDNRRISDYESRR